MSRARRMAEAVSTPLAPERSSTLAGEIVVGDVRIPRSGAQEIEIDGRTLRLTNLDRVMYPETGFTKADVVAHYLEVAEVMLPHLVDRPLTLGRFPGGVDGRGFAQAEVPGCPSWVRTVPLALATKDAVKRYVIAEERATLVWLAQMGTIELHAFLGKAASLDRPTAVVFDLDPGPGVALAEVAEVALLVRERLRARGRDAWVKTSGSIGLHVLSPCDDLLDYGASRALAAEIAREAVAEEPLRVTDVMATSARAGRVLIDVRQNAERLSTVVAWSLRSTPRPRVSMPIAWEELRRGALIFEAEEAAARAREKRDEAARIA